jgi:hypothetical protein
MSIEKVNFFEIFQQNPDGSLSPKVKMNVNGIQFGPGVSFSPGVFFGGVDFYKYKNLPVAVEKQGDIFMIKGFYQI